MQSECPQASGHTPGLVCILGPTEAYVLVAADESNAFGESIHSFEESFSDRFSNDLSPWTAGITLHRSSFPFDRNSGLAAAPIIVWSDIAVTHGS